MSEREVEAYEIKLAGHLAELACRWPDAEHRFFDSHAAFFARNMEHLHDLPDLREVGANVISVARAVPAASRRRTS